MKLVVLGAGYAGSAVARLARSRGLDVVATVRSEARAAPLRASGFDVRTSLDVEVDADTHVVVSFPPDGTTDAAVAPRFAGAGSIAYVSSTGVYGATRGVIDDTTEVAPERGDRGSRVLAAEAAWRAVGATVLRCPAIYGPDRGMHVRVAKGLHKLPGDGAIFQSRIHVEDLAALLLAAATTRGETFVVGDHEPATQAALCAWLTEARGLPYPPSVPPEEVHETLRSDRRVDPSRALAVLGVTLRYPSFRDGM